MVKLEIRWQISIAKSSVMLQASPDALASEDSTLPVVMKLLSASSFAG
jgi:hypothetical protein